MGFTRNTLGREPFSAILWFMKLMRTSYWVGGLFPGLFLGLFLGGTALATVAKGQSAQAIRVLALDGKAMSSSKRNQSRPLEKGSEIEERTLVQVDEGSSVVLSLGRDVVSKVVGPAKINIETVRKHDWQLNIERGIVASAVRNPQKRPNHFTVKSRTATMGVRGTVFFVNDQPDQPLFVCTCEGTVKFTAPDGAVIDQVKARHHDRPLSMVRDGNGKVTAKTVSQGTQHSDSDVVALNKLLTSLNESP